jgi:hypothetical protein
MATLSAKPASPTAEDLEQMHAIYRKGGMKRLMAPQVVYADSICPYAGCGQSLQALDFCLEHYGPAVHDPLVRAWWDDTGFAGRCPKCGGWIHFTIRDKKPITAEEAESLPQLPDDWQKHAVIL